METTKERETHHMGSSPLDASLGEEVWEFWAVKQLGVLQFCSSTMAGHAAPPFCTGVTMARVRCCVPPPHAAVQSSSNKHKGHSRRFQMTRTRTEPVGPIAERAVDSREGRV